MTNFVSLVSRPVLRELVWRAVTSPPGNFVEVGVYQGGSAHLLHEIAVEQGRKLFLYDTFSGMPFQGPDDVHPAGDFADCSEEMARAAAPTAIIIKAVFPDCPMPEGPIAVAHIDCDQYQSVLDCCTRLAPLMAPGGFMWFDDWSLDGAHRAIVESFPEEKIQISTFGNKAFVMF